MGFCRWGNVDNDSVDSLYNTLCILCRDCRRESSVRRQYRDRHRSTRQYSGRPPSRHQRSRRRPAQDVRWRLHLSAAPGCRQHPDARFRRHANRQCSGGNQESGWVSAAGCQEHYWSTTGDNAQHRRRGVTVVTYCNSYRQEAQLPQGNSASATHMEGAKR